MQTGLALSAAGHAAVIALVLFGGWFAPEPLPPPEVADVSIVSEEDFAALTRPEAAPEVVDAAPQSAEPPAPEEAPVAPPAAQAPPEVAPQPEAAAPPEAEALPDRPAPLAPEAEVTDVAPEVPPAPPPAEAGPPTDLVAVPRPAPRVAPEAAPPPPPEAEAAPVVVERTSPAPLPDAPPVVEEPPAAPEEAAPEIVTEAEQSSTAPVRSPRPQARPERPRRAASAGTSASAASANAARPPAAAPGSAAEAAIPAGPPITRAERDAFRLAVSRCWVVDVGSEAASVTVTVGFDMTRQGKVNGDVRMISASGGSPAATKAAFEAARRAVLRCGVKGYDLPAEKYGQWKSVEITFDPSQMRLR